jgi:peptidoglycan hydrolase-like protein with peptidoglycan-binding domain
MKKLAIALLATAAFGLPAMAQNANAPKTQSPQAQQPSQPKPMQPTVQSQPSNPQQAAQNQSPIAAKDLSKSDIRQVQTALNKDGFRVGRIDGLWGRDTSNAVRKFQKNKGLQANGQIDQMTVADLGLNTAQFAPQKPQGSK